MNIKDVLNYQRVIKELSAKFNEIAQNESDTKVKTKAAVIAYSLAEDYIKIKYFIQLYQLIAKIKKDE